MPASYKPIAKNTSTEENSLLKGSQPKVEFLPRRIQNSYKPFFLLAPIYLVVSILLWSAFSAGMLPLSFLNQPLEWQRYEIVFGISSAMIIGYILYAMPEINPQDAPVVRKMLLPIVVLWLLGRLSFWLVDWLGIAWLAITNVPLLLWGLFLLVTPMLNSRLHRQLSLVMVFLILSGLQMLFFAAKLNWLKIDSMLVLNASLGILVIWGLLVARHINTLTINRWLEQQNIAGRYLASPPRYNLAILTLTIYSMTVLFFAQNSALTWLAFAAMAALFNTLNDFFIDDDPVFIRPLIWPLFVLLVMMALGYGLMAWHHLTSETASINPLLTMGALGMVYYMMLMLFSQLQAERQLIANHWLGIGALLIILASITAVLAPVLLPNAATHLIILAGLIWMLPFLIYLKHYGKWLLTPMADE